MNEKLKKIVVVVNGTKPLAKSIADTVLKICNDESVEVKVTKEYPIPADFIKGCDGCCVIGGDGTLLSVVPQALEYDVPLIGINLGKLGFLTTLGLEDIYQKLPGMLNGGYVKSKRTTLECKTAKGEVIHAFNDVVIKHVTNARLASLDVFIGEQHVSQYYSDGLIFCTPTGTTGYNLSAGGPIIYPKAKVLAMTPVCPHKLTNRSVVFDDETTLRVENTNPETALTISVDGKVIFNKSDVFPLEVKISPKSVTLLVLPEYSYFKMLCMKLNWN